jgi:hypothetical protein
MITLNMIADFLWCWGHIFFLETSEGCFLWSDPEYPGGDNTIRPYNGTLQDYLHETGIPFVRDKGKHRIKDYCGENVAFINCMKV